MQQRQLRLGDIIDDYCPRERRVTNHAVVAMIGDEVKQTRCTTCDADHEYKHARVPRQRRKADTPPALYAQVAAAAPKHVAHDAHAESPTETDEGQSESSPEAAMSAPAPSAQDLDTQEDNEPPAMPPALSAEPADVSTSEEVEEAEPGRDAGDFESVHRPLIRATLPRHEGQQPPQRQAPDFTIRQPGGRPGRFRPRNFRGGQAFGGRADGNGSGFGQAMRGGPPRHGAGRPPAVGAARPGRNRRPGSGKRSK